MGAPLLSICLGAAGQVEGKRWRSPLTTLPPASGLKTLASHVKWFTLLVHLWHHSIIPLCYHGLFITHEFSAFDLLSLKKKKKKTLLTKEVTNTWGRRSMFIQWLLLVRKCSVILHIYLHKNLKKLVLLSNYKGNIIRNIFNFPRVHLYRRYDMIAIRFKSSLYDSKARVNLICDKNKQIKLCICCVCICMCLI